MPQKKQPRRLESFALKAVGAWVKMLGRGLTEPVCLISQRDSDHGLVFLHHTLAWINETLYASVPWYLFDKMATEVLMSINNLIQETKSSYDAYVPMPVFLTRMKVVVSLTEVVVHPHLRHLDISHWPKIMRHVLNQNLHRLTGLEELNLGSGSGGWDTSEAEKYILSGVKRMTNLTSLCLCFDCTNNILQVVGNNCPLLQSLDVTSSRSVTDKSIPALLNCRHLKDVKLYRTSVSVDGYKQLLLNLPELQDIGRCDDFGCVLEKICEENLGPLSIQALQCRDVTVDHLNMLVSVCSNLTHISVFHDERVSDLTILSALCNLKEIKLLNCDFYSDNVKELLEVRGENLTYLHLEHVDEMDLNALIYISQLCPRLKKLTLYNCEFTSQSSTSFHKLPIEPFRCLEHLVCVVDCTNSQLEFLLKNCVNIRYIQIGSSTGIGDDTMCKILSQNPMKRLEELKILYSYSLSMTTVRLLMSHCERLKVLSELESWEGISDPELQDFKDYVRANNLNLDVKCRFSN